MANAPRSPKLKVYSMPAGFYDAVVAAPSQKAALEAWGTTTDLFAAGRATLVEDAAIQAEALARPGEVIKRSRGDEAAMLGPEPTRDAPKPKAAGKPKAVPKPRPPPDRSAVDEAEQALADSESAMAHSLEAIAAERKDLDRREREARADGEAEIGERRRKKHAAHVAYERAVAKAGRT